MSKLAELHAGNRLTQDIPFEDDFGLDLGNSADGHLEYDSTSSRTEYSGADWSFESGVLVFKSVTTVAMNDAAHALVLGSAGAAQTQLTGNIVFCDPESGGVSEDLTLPAEASSTGLELTIYNTGGEGIVVKDDGGATVATLETTEHCIVACDGTTWYGFVGAET